MDTQQEKTETSNDRRHGWWGGSAYGGVYMLVVGILFLLNNFGYFQGDAWGKLWPVFIIIPALAMIFSPWRHRRD